MWTFIALVLAVIALVMAKRARNEVRELRAMLASREVRPSGAAGFSPPEIRAEPIAPRKTSPVVVPDLATPDVVAPSVAARVVADAGGLKPAAPQEPTREPVIPIYQPEPVSNGEPPPPFVPPVPPAPPKPPVWKQIDWESVIGVKLFSWIAGILTVFGAIYALKYSVDHGWISPPVRAAMGLLFGSALLVVCELRVSRNYKYTANAMLGAGIAILYATLFAIHSLWHLLPQLAVFAGMAVVTAVAVALSIRRDSLFIALLGMMGGFATPAVLSTGENRPIGLFSYLLLLNAGLAWVAYRKRWPLLTIGTIVFSVIYQWAWIAKFLDAAQLPLAAGIFVVFAIVAATGLWIGRRDDKQQPLFDRMGQIGAALPLIFALFAAAVPAYGTRFHILFTFLLLIAGGLGVIAILRKLEWLHAVGAVATTLTFAIWLVASYERAGAWPAILAWLSAFVVLYLAIAMRLRSRLAIVAPMLLFVLPALVLLEPEAASPLLLFSVLFVLVALAAAYALRYEEGLVYFVGAFFAIVTEALWSAKHMNGERLYGGLAIYGVFGVLFLAVPALARRFNRRLAPQNGVAVTAIVSVAMLLFLTFDGVAAAALWGLAILLVVLAVGAIVQARHSSRPWLAGIAVILSWIVLGSWWEAAPLEAALIPALFVIAAFGVVVVLAMARGERSFSNQTFLALIGHVFLLVVAQSPSLAFPPWPFLAVLFVLDLAIGVAALYLRRASLVIAAAVMSQLVLLAWTTIASGAPWPNIALAATIAVAAYALGFYAARPMFAHAASVALLAGHVVAISAGMNAANPLFGTLLATQAVLAIATLVVAARTEKHLLAVLSVPLTAAGAFLARTGTPMETFLFAAVPYALYVSYPLVLGARAKRAIEPYLAAVLASVPFFFLVRGAMNDAGLGYAIGILPVGQALLMLVLLVRLLRVEPPAERFLTRLALVAASALAFITVAIPLQLEKQWITIGWALLGAALVWLYRRIPHRGLLVWAATLLVVVFVRLTVNPAVLSYHPPAAMPVFNWYLYAYLVCAGAFFAASYFAPKEYGRARSLSNAAGAILLFCLLNIEIADYFSDGPTLTFNFLSSSLAQDLTYTIGWAIFAIAMLIAGIALHKRAARVAAIALLSVTIFKCFLHDLGRLGGLYRIASFLGLALALLMVSVLLQKFVLSRRTPPPPAPEVAS